MPFPDSERVIYTKNPLLEVICQLRFEPILRIEKDLPVEFQELIRVQYPRFDVSSELNMELPDEIQSSLPAQIRDTIGKKIYGFTSADKHWSVGLGRDSLSLTTNNYVRWEEFESNLSGPLNALQQVYSPVSLVRVGLRYKDIILRSTLGLDTSEWKELLKPHIAGVLASSEISEDCVLGSINNEEVLLSGNLGKVKIRHGLVTASGSGANETGYLVDSDFYCEQMEERIDVSELLNNFNQRAGRLWRWCITETLHEAMEPQTI